MNSNAYMNAYMKKRYHQRREEWIQAKGGVCVDCGSTEKLEFDHADRKIKKFSVSHIWSYRAEKLAAEMEKCVLRCKPCHIKKTSSERGVEHGGGLTGKRNCRCDPCRARKNEYQRNRKRAKK